MHPSQWSRPRQPARPTSGYPDKQPKPVERPLLARPQVDSWLATPDDGESKGPYAGLIRPPDSTKPRRSRSERGFVYTQGVLL